MMLRVASKDKNGRKKAFLSLGGLQTRRRLEAGDADGHGGGGRQSPGSPGWAGTPRTATPGSRTGTPVAASPPGADMEALPSAYEDVESAEDLERRARELDKRMAIVDHLSGTRPAAARASPAVDADEAAHDRETARGLRAAQAGWLAARQAAVGAGDADVLLGLAADDSRRAELARRFADHPLSTLAEMDVSGDIGRTLR
ncbi:uncharacterized protein V1510DRAFT_441497 [Dipodascopsis tothii]|uniref:uncharacterized protein n=1 Tax=Dipodascopsis tothii TaxID=44089 RepID=UPI0034CEBEBB